MPDKQETYGGIIRSAYPELTKSLQDKTIISDTTGQQKELKHSIQPTPAEKESKEVIVDNDKTLQCTFCPECHPQL